MGTLIDTHNHPAKLRKASTCPSETRTGSTYYIETDGSVHHKRTNVPVRSLFIQRPDGKFIVPFAVAMSIPPRVKLLVEQVEFQLNIKLRDYQEVDMERIIESLVMTGSSYFIAQCAYGKTIMMFYIMMILKQKTIIVLPNLSLVEQTCTGLCNLIDPASSNIQLTKRLLLPCFSGIQVLGVDRLIHPNTNILICYIGRLDNTPKSNPVQGLNQFKFVILDEVHLLTAPGHITGLLSLRPSRISAFTATAGDRNLITEMFVGSNPINASMVKNWQICFPRITTNLDTLRVAELVNKSIEVYKEKLALRTEMKAISKFDFFQEEMRANGFDTEETSTNVTDLSALPNGFKGMLEYGHTMTVLSANEAIRDFILDTVNYFAFHKERVIIITVRNEMTDMLYEALHEDSEEGIRYIVDYLDRKKPECSNCNVLIGTHKKMGTGFDEKNSIKDFEGQPASILIFLGSIKDKTLMYQLSGRAFRSNDPLVIFPLMIDIPFSRNHIDEIKEVIANEYKECEISAEMTSLIESITSTK